MDNIEAAGLDREDLERIRDDGGPASDIADALLRRFF
jgi:hypothetical protein